MVKVQVKFPGKIFNRGITTNIFIDANGQALKRTAFVGAKVRGKNMPKATGKTERNVRGRVIDSKRAVIRVEGDRAEIMPLIELGRRPTGGGGFIARFTRALGFGGNSKSFRPIKAWVKRVINPPNLDQVAFLVFRKIHEKGFKGQFVFKRSRPTIARLAGNFFQLEYRKLSRELSK